MLYTYDKACSVDFLKSLRAAVLAGEIIAFPTDTLYALACDATNSLAINKLFSLKKRPIEKTVPVLVESIAQAFSLVKNNNTAYNLAVQFWPGALTLVLEVLKNNGLSNLAIQNSTVGLRMPNNLLALDIIRACGIPLIGSSANISGHPAINNAEEIYDTFGEDIAYVVKSDITSSGNPSTVLRVSGECVEMLRIGMISPEEISEEIGLC